MSEAAKKRVATPEGRANLEKAWSRSSGIRRPSKNQMFLFWLLRCVMMEALGEEVFPEYEVKAGNLSFFVDIAIPSRKVCVEVDGKYWHGRPKMKKSDRRKDFELWNHGWKVYRVDANEVYSLERQLKVLKFICGY